MTSTLSPTLLNEARFGYHINKGSQIPPWQSSDSSIKNTALQFIGQGGTKAGGTAPYPVLVRPATRVYNQRRHRRRIQFDNGHMGMRLNCGVIVPNLLNDPLFEYVDFLQLESRQTRVQVRRRLALSAYGRICVSAIYRRAVRQPRGHDDAESPGNRNRRHGHAYIGADALAGWTNLRDCGKHLPADLAHCRGQPGLHADRFHRQPQYAVLDR